MVDRAKDPYSILGVPRDADARTIKRAYRRLAQEHHPDRNRDDAVAEERFKAISGAYAVLSDSERRRGYDEFGEIALDPNFNAAGARQARHNPFGGGGSRVVASAVGTRETRSTRSLRTPPEDFRASEAREGSRGATAKSASNSTCARPPRVANVP